MEANQFEKLINSICQKILGTGVVTFSTGKDGGRDGKFIGTAQHYVSDVDRWSGKFVIQAKHTTSPIASCSDSEFEKIIDDEIIKIKNLKANNEIDNYLFFTNRKYSGVKGERLPKKIITETGVQNAVIIGKETINNQYLNPNKDIVKLYKLDLNHIPFDFSDQEIKEIILAFKQQLPSISSDIKKEVEKLKYDYSHIEKDKKNEKNKLSGEYYRDSILNKSLMDFDKIEKFLNNPVNEELKQYYFDTAHELNQIIFMKRENYEAFEELFVHIYQLICDGSVPLKGGKRHITTFLHYMYMECLIGKK
ncbi:MAG: ABC-three component system protein [Ignavibacteriaceae bacterium]